MISNGIQHIKSTAYDSPCWSGLLKVKHLYTKGRSMVVKGGKHTGLSEVVWFGSGTLKGQFPELFEIRNETRKSVRKMADYGWNLSFRRC